jgi:hypothetical protein
MRIALNHPRLRHACAAAVLAIAAVGAAPASAADELLAQSIATIRETTRRQIAEGMLEGVVEKVYEGNLAPEQSQAAQAMLRAVMSNEQFSEYMARLLLPLFRQNAPAERVSAALRDGMLGLTVKGMQRLPAERQAMFLRHMLDFSAVLKPEACAAVFFGALPPGTIGRLERRYLATLDAAKFADIMTLYAEAAISELEGLPGVRSVSAVQAKAAEEALVAAAAQRMRETMSPQAVQRVARNLKSAPEADVCLYMRNFLHGALDVREPERSWVLVNLVQKMQ